MTKFTTLVFALLVAAMMLTAGSAQAQLERAPSSAATGLSANINSGVFLADDALFSGFVAEDFDRGVFDQNLKAAYHLAGDLTYRTTAGFTLGAGFGWSPMNETEFLLGRTATGENVEANNLNLYLFNANVGYEVPMGPVGVFARAGVGGATMAMDAGNAEGLVNDDSNTHWQTPVALGLNYAITPVFTIDLQARDNIIYGANEIDDTSHNFYFGAGISMIVPR